MFLYALVTRRTIRCESLPVQDRSTREAYTTDPREIRDVTILYSEALSTVNKKLAIIVIELNFKYFTVELSRLMTPSVSIFRLLVFLVPIFPTDITLGAISL